MSKLVIVSHTPHYKAQEQIVGWGATVREIDHLATLFDVVVHVAPLHDAAPPASSLPYTASNVRHRAVSPAGGPRLLDKLGVLVKIPEYLNTILPELQGADGVHVRTPANISLVALIALAFVKHPKFRWYKYAGNWQPARPEAWSYRLQRWWLKQNLSRGQVTINGTWPGQPAHIHSFVNPCLTEQEIGRGKLAAAHKQLELPPKLLFVGKVAESKGARRVIEIVAKLRECGVETSLDLVGSGPDLSGCEQLVEDLKLEERITFHGWQPRQSLESFYSKAHFLILPSDSEGWPKVVSEAMAYGTVPLASDVSNIREYLERNETGKTFEPDNLQGFADAIVWYLENPNTWRRESLNGVRAANSFSYHSYLSDVISLIDKYAHE